MQLQQLPPLLDRLSQLTYLNINLNDSLTPLQVAKWLNNLSRPSILKIGIGAFSNGENGFISDMTAARLHFSGNTQDYNDGRQ